ncbi:hypothetical protein [Acutalibacter sp. 1XD8-36]|uniref:hypothetical protein n=1 Tax=Acutalibacter sp. 1XD8-36 TaxID=2320852 RepID=UPI001412F723|nr:hypothetical protein [Acutalibacter sp. 1XD8-36]NBJ87910.1 hypothetical protein [Acutalibacter sp. 1XD8-36]
MTEQEASRIRSAYCNGFQYPFGGGFVEKCDMDEVNRTAELLDEAIKKQIPQHPILVNNHQNRPSPCYECPTCHGSFTGTENVAYCYHCGQALNWDKILIQ